jgi:hypothetical protein
MLPLPHQSAAWTDRAPSVVSVITDSAPKGASPLITSLPDGRSKIKAAVSKKRRRDEKSCDVSHRILLL